MECLIRILSPGSVCNNPEANGLRELGGVLVLVLEGINSPTPPMMILEINSTATETSPLEKHVLFQGNSPKNSQRAFYRALPKFRYVVMMGEREVVAPNCNLL